jgi:hypothetical protein
MHLNGKGERIMTNTNDRLSLNKNIAKKRNTKHIKCTLPSLYTIEKVNSFNNHVCSNGWRGCPPYSIDYVEFDSNGISIINKDKNIKPRIIETFKTADIMWGFIEGYMKAIDDTKIQNA